MMQLKDTLTGLQHLGVPVTNLERSRTFYLQLGFTEALRTDLKGAEGDIQVCFLALGTFILELYQLVGAEREEVGRRGDGHIDHFALDVSDIEAAFAAVKAAGLTPLEESPVYLPFWEKGIRYFVVRGPDGEKVEFCQRL
jgi:lactoylglutathione lyase